MARPTVTPVDAFDLPEWLGEEQVTWQAASSLDGGHLVSGAVVGPSPEQEQECDILACDLAHPQPVLDEKWRAEAHHTWAWGEVLLVRYDGRVTLVLPGTAVAAEPALEAVRRLARSVGAPTDRFTVALRL